MPLRLSKPSAGIVSSVGQADISLFTLPTTSLESELDICVDNLDNTLAASVQTPTSRPHGERVARNTKCHKYYPLKLRGVSIPHVYLPFVPCVCWCMWIEDRIYCRQIRTCPRFECQGELMVSRTQTSGELRGTFYHKRKVSRSARGRLASVRRMDFLSHSQLRTRMGDARALWPGPLFEQDFTHG